MGECFDLKISRVLPVAPGEVQRENMGPSRQGMGTWTPGWGDQMADGRMLDRETSLVLGGVAVHWCRLRRDRAWWEGLGQGLCKVSDWSVQMSSSASACKAQGRIWDLGKQGVPMSLS